MAFITRLILALFGMAFAVLLTLSLLFWLMLNVAFASLRWLLTGQKPQVLLMWQQIQALRKGVQSARSSSGSRSSDGQWHDVHAHPRTQDRVVIEDAVVREISDKRGPPHA